MSLDEIRQAVLDEFTNKLTDVNNQISQVTNALAEVDLEIAALQANLDDARNRRQEHNRNLNQLNKRRVVLQDTVTKLGNGDIIIRNKP